MEGFQQVYDTDLPKKLSCATGIGFPGEDIDSDK